MPAGRAGVVLVALAGCGRIGFGGDGRDAFVDDVVLDGVDAPCTPGWGVPQPETSLNTSSHESDIAISNDQLVAYYTSNRVPAMGYAIFSASRTTSSEPFTGGAPFIDTVGNDHDPSITADGLELYFQTDVGGTNEIYVATRASTTTAFGVPAPVTITGEVTGSRASPDISPDGLTLYYGAGSLEIAYATRPDRATSSFAFVREVDEVNAPQTDGAPTLTSDGLELYFESFRLGSANMFRATRATTADLFGAPVIMSELITEVPGATAAGGPSLAADGNTLYMFLNVGQIDIYAAARVCD